MVDLPDLLSAVAGFEWDAGNAEKSWIRHLVSRPECEELFLNEPLVMAVDIKHSTSEPRYFALGQTDAGRRLFAVFTIRNVFIRVISARDMNRRERKVYDNAQDEASDAQNTEV